MREGQTCIERIHTELTSRFIDLTLLATPTEELTDEQRASLADDYGSDAANIDQEWQQERAAELPLCINVKKMVQIEFSTGGPADYVTIILGDNGEPESGQYHFADWFDHAECQLTQEQLDIVNRLYGPYFGSD